MHLPSHPLNRRAFLRGAGVTLALPFLEAMQPAFGAQAATAIPRRMVCIQTNMGILPQFFFPEAAGRDYASSAYLERLKAHRDQITVFSGVSYPGVDGGHTAQKCFLTGTPHPARGGFRNGISLDQFVAEEIGNQTRHPSLVLAVTNENATMSFTRNGAPIPSEQSPKKLFERLFIQGNNKEVSANVEALQRGRSLLVRTTTAAVAAAGPWAARRTARRACFSCRRSRTTCWGRSVSRSRTRASSRGSSGTVPTTA
jgi:hypothetical protein